MTRTPGRLRPLRTRRSYRWRRRFLPMLPASVPVAAACMGLRAKTCERWRIYCRPSKCSARVWLTMRWVPRRTRALSSSFTRNLPLKKAQLAYYKLGDGPFYVFYTPFHLPHIQIASTMGRAVIHRDPTVAPMAGPVCEVVTVAKRDLKAGERLDGVGGFCAYGLIDNAASARHGGSANRPFGGLRIAPRCCGRTKYCRSTMWIPSAAPGTLWIEQNELWPQLRRTHSDLQFSMCMHVKDCVG